MDTFTPKQRSECMSKIRSKWTKPEKKIHNYLKGNKISHKMHPSISGRPDLIIAGNKAVFLHGCFWHKCPKHYRKPNSNKDYWENKIANNVRRDSKNKGLLKSQGYSVISLWEHDVISNIESCLKKLGAK